MSIDEVLDMLKRFKDSPDKKEKVVNWSQLHDQNMTICRCNCSTFYMNYAVKVFTELWVLYNFMYIVNSYTCIFTVPFNELFIVVSWHVLNLRIHVFTLYVYMCFTITVYFCVFSGRIWVYAAELVWRVQIFPSVPRERITHYSSIVRRNHWERISNVSVKNVKMYCIALKGVCFLCLVAYTFWLVSRYMALGIALRYVLEALKKQHNSKMYFFGIAALDRFKTRYASWNFDVLFMVQEVHLNI